MTNDQAINILKEQIASLQWVSDKTHTTWLTQTKSEINKIFGPTSEECFFLTSFRFVSPFSNDSATNQIIKNRPTASDFLVRCIQTIERRRPLKEPEPIIKYIEKPVVKEVIKEVVKEVLVYPPKPNVVKSLWNWIKRRDIIALIVGIITVLGLPFGLGWLLGENKADIKNIELRRDNKELMHDTSVLGTQYRALLDSPRVNPSLDIPANKPDSNAKGNKDNKNPDTTHKK